MIGCRFSLYPMSDNFVEVILGAVEGLKEPGLSVQTDDVSTCLIGEEDKVFATLEEAFAKAAQASGHLVMVVTLSRGCPGEPDGYCIPGRNV